MEALSISNELFTAGSPLIALFCLIPLYTAIYRCKGYREAFLLMFIQTLTVHLLSSFWLANFHDFAIFTLGASAMGTSFMAGCCGEIMYILPSLLNKSNKLQEAGGKKPFAPFLRIFWFAAAFTFWEWVKSTGFLAYPWGTISMGAWKWKWIIQIASVTGVWGITFIFALFAGLAGEAQNLFLLSLYSPVKNRIINDWTNALKMVAVIFAVVLAYGIFEFYLPRIPEKYMNAVVVQQNIDTWREGEKTALPVAIELTENCVNSMKKEGMKPDLIIWSEGILGRTFPQARFTYEAYPEDESLKKFITRMDTPLLAGGQVILNQAKRHFGNAAILFDKKGNYSGFFCKMHLVPFAEEIPYSDSPIVRTLLNRIVGFSSGWTKGSQYVLFNIPLRSEPPYTTPLEYRDDRFTTLSLRSDGTADPVKTEDFIAPSKINPDSRINFTTPICFEDSFTDVCRPLYNMGSEVFVTITNDAWSGTNSAEFQHFIASSYMSIQFRTTMVRCGNAGFSAVIDPSGKITDSLPTFTRTSKHFRIPVYERTQTVFSQFGDWFIYLLIAFISIVTVYVLIEAWKDPADEKRKIPCITIITGRKSDESISF